MNSADVLGDHCLMFFQGNYMWSQGILLALGLIPFGAADAGEVFKVGNNLQKHVGNNESWFGEWNAMGQGTEELAEQAEKENHFRTAGGAFLRAATYHFLAERFLSNSDARKLQSYKDTIKCFQKGWLYRYPRLEEVDIPYEGKFLAAYFLPGEGVSEEKPGRTMVFFDGLDVCKEITTNYAAELFYRGINTLVVDGPGQGESLRLRDIPSRFDYEVPAGAAFDYAEERPEVDSNRIGVMALSMGGYYAPRAAAFEHRYKICVAWSAHFDYHALWVKRRQVMESGGSITSAPGFQLPWVLGKKNMDEAMKKLEDYTLEGVAEKIQCPLLIVHGEDDSIVPVEMAYRLYEAAGTEDKTLTVFTKKEGGSEHCGVDNISRTVSYIADWIADRL